MSTVRPRQISAAPCVSVGRWRKAIAEPVTINTAPILMAAAVAATMAAAIAVSAPVRAMPPAPQAPACSAWTHTGGLNIDQDNGLILQIDNWLGNSAGTGDGDNAKLLRADGTPVFVGSGTFQSPQTGKATGGNTGNKFDLTVVFGPTSGSVSNHYTGTIDDMGAVKGTTVNSKGVTNAFAVQEHFSCAKQDAPAPAPAPDANRPVHCTAGYTLPPGSDCSKTPNPNPPAAPPPPHDAISVSFGNFSPVTGLPVTVTNSSAVSGSCSYDSTPFGYHHGFTVAPKASTTWNIKGAWPTNTTYNVTVSCTQTGQNNSIGLVKTTKQF